MTSTLTPPGATAESVRAPAEPLPGYRLVRGLGAGGSGEVWEAVRPDGARCAVKLTTVHPRDPLWDRELEGLGQVYGLHHRRLLEIERFSLVANRIVVVMELADGTLLDRFDHWIDRGKPGVPRAELLVRLDQVAEGLDWLSSVHRLQHLDVKPSNLMLCDSWLKVGDFGLVQPRVRQLYGRSIAFTPRYAAPELYRGEVNPAVDQFALAVTYQELLTGQGPYEADNIRRLYYKMLSHPPNLEPLPEPDREVIAKALNRDPERRFESCRAMIAALREATGVHRRRSSPARLLLPRFRSRPRPISREPRTTRLPGLALKQTEGVGVSLPTNVGAIAGPRRVRQTFLATLPLTVYATKLRGFMDETRAEILECSAERTVLGFGERRRLLARRPETPGVRLQIDTVTPTAESSCRVVDVTVWAIGEMPSKEVRVRAGVLIPLLRSYLMSI